MSDIREVRFLVSYSGKMFRLCKLAFSRSDASIYLFPYAPTGKFYFGGRSMAEKNFEDTFDYTNDEFAETIPKLSIHQSGKVYLEAGDYRSVPLQIPPLVRTYP